MPPTDCGLSAGTPIFVLTSSWAVFHMHKPTLRKISRGCTRVPEWIAVLDLLSCFLCLSVTTPPPPPLFCVLSCCFACGVFTVTPTSPSQTTKTSRGCRDRETTSTASWTRPRKQQGNRCPCRYRIGPRCAVALVPGSWHNFRTIPAWGCRTATLAKPPLMLPRCTPDAG